MIIGITGGIGSGKSVVCDIFRMHNVPIFDADNEAKALNDSSPIIREKLTAHFGSDIYNEGKLDKKKFASLIFNNEDNLKIANSIIHPEVATHMLEWCKKRENHPLVIIDAAILIEAGFDKYVDKIITIYSPTELRTERVVKRDNTSRDQVESRMKRQIPEEEKIKAADWVIINDEKDSLIKQVSTILDEVQSMI